MTARPSILANGVAVPFRSGQSVAAALLDAGIRRLRLSPRAGAARGAFCMMGVCQECVLRVDGRLVQACLTECRPAMVVEYAP